MSKALVLVDPDPSVSPEVRPETMMLGLPIVRRSALAARKAGFDRVIVAAADDPGTLGQALADTGAEIVSETGPRTSGDGLALPWNRVVDTRALRDLRRGRPSSE